MKIEITDYCIRCGLCEDLYPNVFKRNFDTHNIDVLYDEIPADLEETVKKAAEDCAVAAIKIV